MKRPPDAPLERPDPSKKQELDESHEVGVGRCSEAIVRSSGGSSSSSGSSCAIKDLGLSSPEFSDLTTLGFPMVDKTGAIADLLNHTGPVPSRIFFARPRKFGKSFTLSAAGAMLAAGDVPEDKRWPGYSKVDIKAVFGGTEVYRRLQEDSGSLGDLLKTAHFVIDLRLGGARTGSELEATIKRKLVGIASEALQSDKAEQAIEKSPMPEEALESLLRHVPANVPVALLIDEYDACILEDIKEKRWAAAAEGLASLRSLLVATKSAKGGRIRRCLVTGVTQLACASLFSGANNFTDMTAHPLLSRVLGFTRQELLTAFPDHLQRLGAGDADPCEKALSDLAEWYNGYCFDGKTSCFNPYPVLVALQEGRIVQQAMEAVTDPDWLGLPPADLLQKAFSEAPDDAGDLVTLAAVEKQQVHALPLLLQVGLLSRHPEQAEAVYVPNKYARRTLEGLLSRAFPGTAVEVGNMGQVLSKRDRVGFQTEAERLLQTIPNSIFKRGELREAPFHAALMGAMLASTSSLPGISVKCEVAVQGGRADIVVEFASVPPACWLFEIGLGTTEDELKAKLAQAQRYTGWVSETTQVLCCVVLVGPAARAISASPGEPDKRVVSFGWSRRNKLGGSITWEVLDKE